MPADSDITSFVESRGGVVRSARLTDAGIGRRAVEAAVRAGLLLRPRRGWVALPGARPLLVSAARFGVVITCRTQARVLGLWVHDPEGLPHVAVSENRTGHVGAKARIHWGRPLIPRHPDILEDPIENVLANIAECEPFEYALATWESALNKGLVDLASLARLPLRSAARRLLDEATPFADAGLETYLRPRLRWLRIPLWIQTWIHGHRVDALLGERLVLQIDGKHHVGAQRSEDIRHDAELLALGYHVIRISYQQMMYEWPAVQDRIMRAIAQGLHRAA